jgi:hypothetical protein
MLRKIAARSRNGDKKGARDMVRRHGPPLHTLALASTISLAVLGVTNAVAGANVKHGTMDLGTWTDAVKTGGGKEARRHHAVYEWDTGLTHEYVYALDGSLVSERRYRAAPAPQPEEIAEASAIVLADPEVADILSRQPTFTLAGGFTIEQTAAEGPCSERTRCLQMLLFDGNNVVRHMLVDLRTGSILERDYIPPRNRGDAR